MGTTKGIVSFYACELCALAIWNYLAIHTTTVATDTARHPKRALLNSMVDREGLPNKQQATSECCISRHRHVSGGSSALRRVTGNRPPELPERGLL